MESKEALAEREKMSSETKCNIFKVGAPLEGVNVNTTLPEIEDRYKQWAPNYDQDLVKLSYSTPECAVKTLKELADQYGINQESKIMDVGAGTGVVGEHLKKEGYKNIDAVDASPEMLEIAKGKNCYSNVVLGGIGNNSLAIPENEYDALLCIGSLTLGHIPPSGISEMLDMVKPGGLYLFTIRCDVDAEEYGYKGKINDLLEHDQMRMICRKKIDYLAASNLEDITRYCYLYAFVKN